jgi:hypothetical protein
VPFQNNEDFQKKSPNAIALECRQSLNHVAVVSSLVEHGRVKAPLQGIVLNLPLTADTSAKLRLILFLQDGKTGRVLGSTEIIFNRPRAGA